MNSQQMPYAGPGHGHMVDMSRQQMQQHQPHGIPPPGVPMVMAQAPGYNPAYGVHVQRFAPSRSVYHPGQPPHLIRQTSAGPLLLPPNAVHPAAARPHLVHDGTRLRYHMAPTVLPQAPPHVMKGLAERQQVVASTVVVPPVIPPAPPDDAPLDLSANVRPN